MMEILRGNLSMMNNNCVRRQPVPGVSDLLPDLLLGEVHHLWGVWMTAKLRVQIRSTRTKIMILV